MNYASMFTSEAWQEFVKIWSAGEFYNGIWATVYSTILATLFALIIGLPLGVLLVVGEEGGVRPLPKPLMTALNTIINILRSIPFLILMIMVIPLSRIIVGTSIGTKGMIVPLVISAFPFISRLMESSLREIDPGVIDQPVDAPDALQH
ncbi:MAG: ABC transporter permease, partial [Oscillospiraceae bacterium]|nr:ABC transporter permease [Oscillospiraceae bacterium]